MRWSKLFIPTLREEPSEGDPRLRLFVRAGYARDGGFLFFGERALRKIEARLRIALLSFDAQEIALGAPIRTLPARIAGELRSYKQLPQVWFQRRGTNFEFCAVGVDGRKLRDGLSSATADCGIQASISDPEGPLAPEEFATPGIKSIAELSGFTGLPETSLIKSVVMSAGGSLVLVLVRGDHALDESKLREFLGQEVRAATEDEIRARFGASPGSLGPVGVSGVRALADWALLSRSNLVCGANRDDYHLRHVTPLRDFDCEFQMLRAHVEGPGQDGIPVLGGSDVLGSVAPWGGLFSVLNETGKPSEPGVFFGEFGLDRMLVAAAGRDDNGLVMPKRIAPFSVAIVPVNVKDADCRAVAERLYETAGSAGCDAVLDDRDERPGVKFKDCELAGIPWRVTVGKKLSEGVVEIFERSGKQSWDVPVEQAVEFVRNRWDQVA